MIPDAPAFPDFVRPRIAFGFVWPKNWLFSAPHSPFKAKFPRSQSGTKFLFASVQARDAELTDVLIGFSCCETSTLVFAT